MPVVIALVSQKGGVGKSTLARGLGALVAYTGVKVRIADLDTQQNTVLRWEERRRTDKTASTLDAKGYQTITDAIADADDVDLLIVDAPGGSNRTTLTIAQHAHLVVQPTGPSIDDLHPGVLLFHELAAAGIPRERLGFALCRTQTQDEEEDARAYLEHAGYAVLPGSIPERATYRAAQNRGRTITETNRDELNQRADDLMMALITCVATQVKSMQDAEKARRNKTGRGTP